MNIENWIFLAVVAVILLFKWVLALIDTMTKRSAGNPPVETPTERKITPIQRAPAESEEQRIRRFLEALGQPTSSTPPPKVTPRPAQARRANLPHVGPLGSPLPPLITRPPPERPRAPLVVTELPTPARAKEFVSTPTVTVATSTPAAVFEVRDTAAPLVEIAPPSELPAVSRPYESAAPPLRQTSLNARALLASAEGLQQAVILREIFGPPRSLQPAREMDVF
jgi:hypothetical protein